MAMQKLVGIYSGVSMISFRGGGGSKYLWKSGGICMSRKPRVCEGGSGACFPDKFLKNGAIWCDLVSILLKFCQKK